MAKFKDAIAASNQPEPEKPINQKTNKPDLDMTPVNAGGFKIPRCVRAHWVAQGAIRGEKLAPLLRDFLTDRYGLPDGLTADDFKTNKPVNQ